jgi:type I restriction enzyme, S subunit
MEAAVEITTAVKNVPGLRFPEFEGEWKVKKLDNLADVKTGNKDTQDREEDGLYPFFVRSDNVERINSYAYDGEAILTSGDGVGVGKNFHYYNGKFNYHQRVYNIHNFAKEVNGKYIYYIFSKAFYKRVIRLSAKNSVDSVRREMITEMSIPIPSFDEQQKISTFLSAADYKIQQLSKKKALLEKYKKGVMQQLFSQQIRFKDDNGYDFPEWEEKKLGELTKLFSKRNKNLIDAKVYSVTNTNGFVLQSDHFSKVVAGDDLSGYKIIKKHDFAYNPARINVGSIAHFKDEIGVISSLYVCFSTNKELDDDFLSYTLELDSTKYRISNFGEGGVRIYLWYPLFALIKIQLPSLNEQKKIVNFLTSIDNKINYTSTQLEQAKQFKKGLLQQLFV